MTYLAQHEVTFTGSDGVRYVVGPGEVVPGFGDWPYIERRAMLNLGRVIDTEARVGRLSTEGGQLHLTHEPPPVRAMTIRTVPESVPESVYEPVPAKAAIKTSSRKAKKKG